MGFSDPPTGDSLTIPDTATITEPRIVIGPTLPQILIDRGLVAAFIFYAENGFGDLDAHYYGIGPGSVAGALIERGFFPDGSVNPADCQVLDQYQYESALANQPIYIIQAFRTIFEGLGLNQEVAFFMDYDISGDSASTLFWDGPVELAGFSTTAGQEILGGQTGTALVTHGAVASHTQVVAFPTAFTGTPKVFVNIASGAGATANWHARAITITPTQFTLFVFGPAVAWANVPVDWIAVGS